MRTKPHTKPRPLGVIKAVGQVDCLHVQVETAIDTSVHGNDRIVKFKIKIYRFLSIIVVPKVIKMHVEPLAKSKKCAKDGANIIFIQIEVIHVNTNIVTAVPD